MASLEAFARVVDGYRGRVDFALVYIAEAHPTDGWDIGSSHRIRTHRSLDERVEAALALRRDAAKVGVAPSDVRLIVDTMHDDLLVAFGATPERLAIVRDGRLEWLGGKGPFEYSVPALEAELARMLGHASE